MVANDVLVTEQTFHGWDKGLDYPTEKTRIEKLIAETKELTQAWYAIFYIQLENGSRIGEAVDCALQWSADKNQEQRVRVEKRRDQLKKLMKIPTLVFQIKAIIPVLLELHKTYKRQRIVNQGICRCTKMLGYNTHALRHCRLSYWILVEKQSELAIAVRVGMTNSKTLIAYMQRDKEEEALRRAIT